MGIFPETYNDPIFLLIVTVDFVKALLYIFRWWGHGWGTEEKGAATVVHFRDHSSFPQGGPCSRGDITSLQHDGFTPCTPFSPFLKDQNYPIAVG